MNNILGYSVGDELLIQVSARIKKYLREHNTLARIGGDKFAILLTDISLQDEAFSVANKLIDAIYQKFNDNIEISASVGIAFYPQDGDMLINKANVALHHEKKNGGGCFMCFNSKFES